MLTVFQDGEVSANLRITPAIDTVKAVFKHLEDPEGCREFFATTFEILQVCTFSTTRCNLSFGAAKPRVQQPLLRSAALCGAVLSYGEAPCYRMHAIGAICH